MAIDTKHQEISNQIQCLRETRRGSPEPSCQLPTQPARSPSYEKKALCAHQIIHNAKKQGLIEIPDRCEVCSSIGKIIAHHPNYDNPFFVVWLCHVCHGKLHLGKFMVHQMNTDCSPEMFEDNTEKLTAIETVWQESTHIINNENCIRGRLKTAIV